MLLVVLLKEGFSPFPKVQQLVRKISQEFALPQSSVVMTDSGETQAGTSEGCHLRQAGT